MVKKFIRLERNFLWVGLEGGIGKLPGKMGTVCLPKQKGGLGIKNISVFNEPLLAKWKWSMLNEGEGLCYEVIRTKYEGWQNLGSSRTLSKQSTCWNDLGRVCGHNEETRWFDSQVVPCVGDGHVVNFWKDYWLGDEKLMLKFNRMYHNSLQKDNVVGVWVSGKERHGCGISSGKKGSLNERVRRWKNFQDLTSTVTLNKHHVCYLSMLSRTLLVWSHGYGCILKWMGLITRLLNGWSHQVSAFWILIALIRHN